jgi:PAS domain S-box-containing protein
MPKSSRAMSLLSPPSSHHQIPNDALLPDLKGFLDAEPRPTFLVAINPQAPTPFELLLCNHAFYMAGLGEGVLAKTRSATLFRSWCQVASHWRSEIDFAGRIWTAFKVQDRWKCIRASDASSVTELRPRADLAIATDDVIRRLEDVKFADVRLAGLYQMMEMSDVGTFEYSPEGILLRANESWYRLSQHPKQKIAHSNFSFMDLVYPPDAPMVLSQWNKLAQGSSVTFEMRWKGRNYGRGTNDGSSDDCQWILSTCVPIMDKDGDLVSIAGNTIDINAQKRVQEEALQRAEALERARRSERKFARFALLAPIAIVILDTQRRMTYCNMRFFELTGLPPVDECGKIDWQSICYPDDQDIVDQQWHKVLRDKQRTQAHFRLNRTWNFGDGAPRQAWAECQTIPELNDEGNVVSIFSVMTDISRFKWAEEVQRNRIEEALVSISRRWAVPSMLTRRTKRRRRESMKTLST